MIYTTSLEEAEHDILEYAKKYTNKEKPLFGFHVFERPGNAYIITTQEGAIERTSERWYSPDGTLVAKSDTSTVSSDPEEKRMFKGWECTHFKKGDIVEFYTPKRHYIALGIVMSDVCPNNENIFTTDFEAYISNQFKDRPTWGEINAVCKAALENLNDYFVQKEIAVNLNVCKEELGNA